MSRARTHLREQLAVTDPGALPDDGTLDHEQTLFHPCSATDSGRYRSALILGPIWFAGLPLLSGLLFVAAALWRGGETT